MLSPAQAEGSIQGSDTSQNPQEDSNSQTEDIEPIQEEDTMSDTITDTHRALDNLIINHEITDERVRHVVQALGKILDVQTITAQAIGTKPTSKPIPKDITFSGERKENVQNFIHKLEAFTTYQNVPTSAMPALMPMVLTGRAFSWFQECSESTKATWTELKAALLQKYGPEARGFTQRATLLERTQLKQESVDDYTRDMVNRLTMAGVKDPEKWTRYVQGLRPSIRAYVLDKDPKSFDEAEQYALRGEDLRRLESNDATMTATEIVSQISQAFGRSTDAEENTQLKKKITTLEDELRSFQTQSAARFAANPRQSSRTYNGRPFCHHCQKAGHYTNACWTRYPNQRPPPQRPFYDGRNHQSSSAMQPQMTPRYQSNYAQGNEDGPQRR